MRSRAERWLLPAAGPRLLYALRLLALAALTLAWALFAASARALEGAGPPGVLG